MEKEMLVVAKLKEGTFEKFMGFMQSPEGLAERAKVAVVEKTIGTVTPDKGGIMFKVHVHNMDVMKQMVSGTHPVGKPIFDECVNSMTAWELTKMEM